MESLILQKWRGLQILSTLRPKRNVGLPYHKCKYVEVTSEYPRKRDKKRGWRETIEEKTRKKKNK